MIFNMAGLGFIFIILPVTVLLLLIWIFSEQRIVLHLLIGLWVLLIGLTIWASISQEMHNVKKHEVYGSYIIDRTKFAGKQADWQYDHYRFEITKDNFLHFHCTNKSKIVKTYKRKIKFVPHRAQALWTFDNETDENTHHIIMGTPTLYRTGWKFHYVFLSRKFHNVFFIKGEWKER